MTFYVVDYIHTLAEVCLLSNANKYTYSHDHVKYGNITLLLNSHMLTNITNRKHISEMTITNSRLTVPPVKDESKGLKTKDFLFPPFFLPFYF